MNCLKTYWFEYADGYSSENFINEENYIDGYDEYGYIKSYILDDGYAQYALTNYDFKIISMEVLSTNRAIDDCSGVDGMQKHVGLLSERNNLLKKMCKAINPDFDCDGKISSKEYLNLRKKLDDGG